MSNQRLRQLYDRVYLGMKFPRCPMTDIDWSIMINSSITCRKAWVFDVLALRKVEDNDALLMVDLTIESTARLGGVRQ